ncbi:hypothetical protein A4S06_05265 [Erysipelotrichaceae bacterium MTC7]|nr:hypothetical protein A4S06_05265 [Erysipelotrichaceae bacterium MTC7]
MQKVININVIAPHENNPRVDLGDLTELIDSIKENGILQPITVVEDGFLFKVIMGHRRLAAAKEAGLTELTCEVVAMDDKKQAATMLLENMQRKDLTPYEEARGFQMCLDLGIEEDELKQRTGLSKKKIRHRLKMLELDQDRVEKASGGSIEEYIALEEIKNLEERNRLVEFVGTDNFNMELLKAKEKQSKPIAPNVEVTDDETSIEPIDKVTDEPKYDLDLMFKLRINFMQKVFERKIDKNEFAEATTFLTSAQLKNNFSIKGNFSTFEKVCDGTPVDEEEIAKHTINYFVVTVYSGMEQLKDATVYNYLKIFGYKLSDDEKAFVKEFSEE